MKAYGIIQRDVMVDKNIPLIAKAIYGLLCSYAGVDKPAFPSIKTISEILGISRSTTFKYLNELKKVGAITVSKNKTWNAHNQYTINRDYICSTGLSTETTTSVCTDPNNNSISNIITLSNNVTLNTIENTSLNNRVSETGFGLVESEPSYEEQQKESSIEQKNTESRELQTSPSLVDSLSLNTMEEVTPVIETPTPCSASPLPQEEYQLLDRFESPDTSTNSGTLVAELLDKFGYNPDKLATQLKKRNLEFGSKVNVLGINMKYESVSMSLYNGHAYLFKLNDTKMRVNLSDTEVVIDVYNQDKIDIVRYRRTGQLARVS